jgi:multiple antibiotic resistance protein
MGPHAPLADFISLWVVVDPFAVLAIFIGVTRGMDTAARRRIAVKSVLISYVVILFFITAGQFIIEAIGLTLHVFQIGGGIVLMLFAISLVVGYEGDEPIALEKYSNPAVYPLAMPAIAGPGVMLMAMLLTDNTRLSVYEQAQTAAAGGVVLAILLMMLFFAQPITRAIGTSGASVIRRIMGMILCAVAVNAILTGLSTWLKTQGLA